MDTAGSRVRNMRKEKGMTQKELADRIGCSKQVISNIERGYNGPRREMLDRLARFFCVPADYFMGLTETRSNDYVAFRDDDERDLIENFRSMDKHERRILLGVMEELITKRSGR